jgi:hypothetical protein
MPMHVKKTVGGTTYATPFFGPVFAMAQVVVDVSTLTTDEVDADGWLKPGVPFQKDGTLISGGGQFVYAVNPEPQNLHLDTVPPTNTSLGNDTKTYPLGMAIRADCNRDAIEDYLGRALTANELAAFEAAGSHFTITNT